VSRRHVRESHAFREVRHGPSEPHLFTPSLDQEVQSEPLVVGLKRIVDELPNAVLERLYLPYGGVPYRPKELLAVWLFAMMQGERSSRRIQECVRWDVRFRYLASNQRYDDRTIGRFLLRMEPALAELFAFVVEKLVAAGLASRRCLAVDGTKIPGNVSQFKTVVKEAMGQSDPDARRMGMKGRTIGYNAQVAVDKDTGYVLGADVVNDPDDFGAMEAVLQAIPGDPPEEVIADGGYESARNLAALDEHGTVSYINPKDEDAAIWSIDDEGCIRCPAGHEPIPYGRFVQHGVKVQQLRLRQCRKCTLRQACGFPTTKSIVHPVDSDPRLRILNYHRARSETGKARLYERRTVERTFGQIKSNMRFGRFHLRGLAKARLEFGFACTAYNLKRYLMAALLLLRALWSEIQDAWHAIQDVAFSMATRQRLNISGPKTTISETP